MSQSKLERSNGQKWTVMERSKVIGNEEIGVESNEKSMSRINY